MVQTRERYPITTTIGTIRALLVHLFSLLVTVHLFMEFDCEFSDITHATADFTKLEV